MHWLGVDITFPLKALAWVSLLSGVGGAYCWGFSAVGVKTPKMEGLATFATYDAQGRTPADVYLRKLGFWNAFAAGLTAVSVGAAAIVTFCTLP